MENILYGADSIYVIDTQAAITFSKSKNYFNKPDAEPYVMDKELKVVPWGNSNDFPDTIVPLISKNAVSSAALDTAIDILYGGGIKFGYKNDKGEFTEFTDDEIEKDPPLAEIQDFFTNNSVDELFGDICSDLKWFAQSPIEIIMNNEAKPKIASVEAKEMMYSRWSSQDKSGKVQQHFYSSMWKYGKPKEADYTTTEALDFKNPVNDLLLKGDAAKGKRYIYPIRMPSPGRQYYPRPYWHSIIDSGWLDFANDIPSYKKALTTNILSVAYHVEINGDYFPRVFSNEGIKTPEEQKKRMEKEYTEIDKFLKGASNAGKAMRSFFFMKPGKNGTMQEVPDIKIKAIERKVGGEFLDDSQEASSMIYTAFRVHPSLVGVIPGKTQSNMSGTDKRELLRIAQIMQNRNRNRILKLFYLIKQVNGWPRKIQFAIPDLMLTTLDAGTDTQKTVNS